MSLSHTLTRLRNPVRLGFAALAVAAVFACEQPASVTVPNSTVASVAVSPAAASVQVGGAVQLSAVTKNSAGDVLTGHTVTWASSNASMATVSSSGLVTGMAVGAATVSATSEGRSGTAAITVANVPVASVSLSPTSGSVPVGAALQLTATPKDGNGNPLSGRTVTWSSSSGSVATVNASGLVSGVAPGSAIITATSEGQSGTSAITVTAAAPPAPVATVTVSPATASVVVSGVVQLTATLKDASGNPLTGRVVTWASGAPAVAAVNGSGLVTGVTPGSATVTATSEGQRGSSAIAVTAPPPPTAGSCLTQPGSTLTVSGLQSAFDNTSLADNTKVDASTAQFVSSAAAVLVYVGGGAAICWHGGEIIGQLPPSTPWSTMHDSYGMNAHGAGFQLENLRVFDTGDGVTMDVQEDANWTMRDLYVKYARDDCVENDFLNSGTIENSFFDGCYDGMSSREYTSVLDGSNNVVVVRNSLWRLQAMDAAYSGPLPNHNAFWKWSGGGDPNNGIGPKLALYNNVFRADEPSQEGIGAGMYMAPPPGKLADCENNVMVWLGSGPFPEPLPTTFNGKTCFTLLTGSQGLQFWNSAVAQWKAAHPKLLQDTGPPIVSMWEPSGGATLTGVVTLTATAVDDQDVAGVQFQLNGQNIGAEVTTESSPAKFTLSWDSHGKPNGTYTLTATARDAAGNTTTSQGITVTISN